jgi:RNA polymerase sigma factor (sigma-70 family)
MTKTDKTLVSECLAGNRKAWEQLVQRYARLLYSIAFRYGLNEDDAADIFQIVCVKLLANLEKLNDDQHLTGWLITTTKHECSHALRHKQRIQPSVTLHEGESKLDLTPAEDKCPMDIVLQVEQEHLVRLAVEDLQGRCRQLIELLYLADPPASYADVSRHLNMPTGAIGPTRARCLKTLKEKLLKRGY